MNVTETLWYSVGYPLQKFGGTRLAGNKSDAVLTFHSVGDGCYDDIAPEAFERLLDRLQARYRIVDLDTIFEEPSSDKRISLTFDDGYARFYSEVVPALRDRGIPATVFVIVRSMYIQDFRHDEDFECEYMGLEELRRLRGEDLVTIGNHTATHPDLTQITDEKRLEDEVVGAKELLETELDISVGRFCYPGNKYDKQCYKVVRRSHEYAVCGGGRTTRITSEIDPHRIPRVNGAKESWRVEWDVSDLSSWLASTVRSTARAGLPG